MTYKLTSHENMKHPRKKANQSRFSSVQNQFFWCVGTLVFFQCFYFQSQRITVFNTFPQASSSRPKNATLAKLKKNRWRLLARAEKRELQNIKLGNQNLKNWLVDLPKHQLFYNVFSKHKVTNLAKKKQKLLLRQMYQEQMQIAAFSSTKILFLTILLLRHVCQDEILQDFQFQSIPSAHW